MVSTDKTLFELIEDLIPSLDLDEEMQHRWLKIQFSSNHYLEGLEGFTRAVEYFKNLMIERQEVPWLIDDKIMNSIIARMYTGPDGKKNGTIFKMIAGRCRSIWIKKEWKVTGWLDFQLKAMWYMKFKGYEIPEKVESELERREQRMRRYL